MSRPRGGLTSGRSRQGAGGGRASRREEADEDHLIYAIREARRGGRRPVAGRAESMSPRPSVMAQMRGGA